MDGASVLGMIGAAGAQCRALVTGEHGLVMALALAGVAGSVSHCAGMCGPFVLAQVTGRLERVPACRLGEGHRLTAALLPGYHLGRLTTYAGLGALGAWLAGGLGQVPGFRWLGAGLLLVAALMFLATALNLNGFSPSRPTGTPETAVQRLARRLLAGEETGLPVGLNGYLLGLTLGFLPCGLVYAALTAAAASGDPATAALAMTAFAAGTIPVLVLIGLAGHAAGLRWHRTVARLTPALMTVNALGLTYLAWQMVV